MLHVKCLAHSNNLISAHFYPVSNLDIAFELSAGFALKVVFRFISFCWLSQKLQGNDFGCVQDPFPRSWRNQHLASLSTKCRRMGVALGSDAQMCKHQCSGFRHLPGVVLFLRFNIIILQQLEIK